MGMFDSFYDEAGGEWQTKAFDCNLDVWRVGDAFPTETRGAFQVELLGGLPQRDFQHSFVTIRDGSVAAVDVPYDDRLPLLGYSSGVTLPRATAAQDGA